MSRIVAGRALAQVGDRDRAVAELQLAAAQLDAHGCVRYLGEAERELGKLGHRTHRRTAAGKVDGTRIESLTGRELQIARLVVDRKTNPEIAAELVPQPEDGRDPPAQHLPQGRRRLAGGARPRRRARATIRPPAS